MTNLQLSADRVLRSKGDTLVAFLQRERESGASWARIALQLADATGVVLNSQTLRRWYAQLVEPVAA